MSVNKLDFDRVKQQKKSFTTILNEVVQNIHDGFHLGLYIYLTTLPPDWNVNKQHLMNHFGKGRDTINKAMKWLHDNYLIKYEQEHLSTGKFGNSSIVVQEGWEFIENIVKKQLHDTAILKNRTTVEPRTGETAPTYKTVLTKKTKNKSSCATRSQKPKAVVEKLKEENGKKHEWAESTWFKRQAEVKQPMYRDFTQERLDREAREEANGLASRDNSRRTSGKNASGSFLSQ